MRVKLDEGNNKENYSRQRVEYFFFISPHLVKSDRFKYLCQILSRQGKLFVSGSVLCLSTIFLRFDLILNSLIPSVKKKKKKVLK